MGLHLSTDPQFVFLEQLYSDIVMNLVDPKKLRLEAARLLEEAEKIEEHLASGKPIYVCTGCKSQWSDKKYVTDKECSYCC